MSVSRPTVYCPNCGKPFMLGANFCPSCGASLLTPQTPLSPSLGLGEPLPPIKPGPFKIAIVALVMISLVLGATTAYYYAQSNDLSQRNALLKSNLAELQIKANSYYSSWQNAQTQGQGLQTQINGLQFQLDNLQAQNNYLSTQVQQLKLELASPTLSLWGCAPPCQTSSANAWSMSSGGWREGGIPDTFTYLPQYTSTVPVGMYFLTLQQYVQFYNCPYATDATTRITCVSGTYNYYSPTTSLNGIFHLAEGCASYVAIYYSTQSGTIYPNVQVTYNPGPSSGVCA